MHPFATWRKGEPYARYNADCAMWEDLVDVEFTIIGEQRPITVTLDRFGKAASFDTRCTYRADCSDCPPGPPETPVAAAAFVYDMTSSFEFERNRPDIMPLGGY